MGVGEIEGRGRAWEKFRGSARKSLFSVWLLAIANRFDSELEHHTEKLADILREPFEMIGAVLNPVDLSIAPDPIPPGSFHATHALQCHSAGWADAPVLRCREGAS